MSCRYKAIKDFDINQSDGVSVSLWWQGCEHRCEGCYSPHTWSFEDGEEFTTDTIDYIVHLLTKDNVKKNLSILGGESLSPNKRDMMYLLVKTVREQVPNIQIWVWTGYLYEDIKDVKAISLIDVLVDGKYEKELHNPTRYKGSSNQRVIDIQKSLEQKNVIFYKK